MATETPPETESAPTPEQEDGQQRGALTRYFQNVFNVPKDFTQSLIRHGRPTSPRAASQAVFTNLFLHILPTRIHRYSLRVRATLGLGIISLVLFFVLTVTGVLLMTYYKPSVDQAYNSMKEIHYVVPTGRFMRNIHRWAAHGMVICVMLHMARAFYTAAYKHPRQFNWVVGMILFVLTLALSFTGYLLPWDQLAFWAVTIGSEIAQSPREITDAMGITQSVDVGGFQKQLLLGANHVGQEALTRFYLLHVMVLPMLMAIFLAIHFWRIRKDGGLTRPNSADEEVAEQTNESAAATQDAPLKSYGLMAVMPNRTPAVNRSMANTIPSYPNALYAIAALTMITLAALLLLGYLFDAPLKEQANPAVPENPAKAPWYFLGLQELVSYSAFAGGVAIPTIVVLGLMLVPYLDREKEDIGVWFSGGQGKRISLNSAIFAVIVVVGMLIFTVQKGWLRQWLPNSDIPQIVITLFNPGTVLLLVFAVWSLFVTKVTNSTRMGALALFTCFLVGFVILTYFATVHRGPNWNFYWHSGQWPLH